MWKYILKRLVWLIPVVLGVSIVIFTLLYFTPGDPVSQMLGDDYTQEQYEEKRHDLGLDLPYHVQLKNFLYDFYVKGDFGTSYITGTLVKDDLMKKIPRTLLVATICCALQVAVGIPLGITAATHQNRWQDRLCIFLAMVSTAIPDFWFGVILLIVFGLKLKMVPVVFNNHWYCYILPCITAAFTGLGGMARQTRSQMLEVIRSDYVVTARSKGLSERTILYKHALPNAIIPIITGIGVYFARALGGTIIVESVFSIPGTGLYLVNAVGQRDYPVVRSTVTLLAVWFAIVMVLVDLIYAFIDPRIKAQYERSNKKKRVKTNA